MSKPKPHDETVVSTESVAAAVETLFVNGVGERATRLVLVDDNRGKRDLGGWCMEAIADHLCKQFGLKLPRRKGKK